MLASTTPVLWFTTRATGTVALVLLTGSVLLGILTTTRASGPGMPRFAVTELHRRIALITLAFLGLHILTAAADTYVPIGWVALVVPFVSSYQPLWIGLGAVAFDLLVAVMVTSLLRRQLGARVFRGAHWLVYLCWPVAVAHGIGAGTDLRQAWMQVLVGSCIASVLLAVAWRLWADPYQGIYRTAAPRRTIRERAAGRSAPRYAREPGRRLEPSSRARGQR